MGLYEKAIEEKRRAELKQQPQGGGESLYDRALQAKLNSDGIKPGAYERSNRLDTSVSLTPETITKETVRRGPIEGGSDYDAADFDVYARTGFVDNPESVIEIYAKDRFPDIPRRERLQRYGIRDGEVVFVDDDGKLKRETPDTFWSKAKRLAGESIAYIPETVLSGVGSYMAGPFGAGAGAAGGEVIRKAVGAAIGDEQDAWDWAKDIGAAGALGGISDKAGRFVTNRINNLLMRRGKNLRFGVGKDITKGYITPEKQAAAEHLEYIAKKEGIPLDPAQLYGSDGLEYMMKYLRNHPKTADLAQALYEKQSLDTERSIRKLYSSMLNPDDSPIKLGGELQETAEKIIENAKNARTSATSPIYREAFQKADPAQINIQPALDELDKIIAKYNKGGQTGRVRSIFEGVKKSLMEESTDSAGKVKLIPETNLEKIDKAKKGIDALIDKSAPAVNDIPKPGMPDFLNEITNVKKKLLSAIDTAGEGGMKYAAARAKHAEMSPAINSLKKSVIGDLANLKKNKTIAKATAQLFSESNVVDPKLLRQARNLIVAENPDLWDRAIGGYIRDTYMHLKGGQASGGNIVNAAGKMAQKIKGSPIQDDILKVALEHKPDKYRNLKETLWLYERLGVGTGKESATWRFKVIEDEIMGNAGKVARFTDNALKFAKSPVTTTVDAIRNKLWDIVINGKQDDIFRAMTDPDVAKLIGEMKPLEKDSEKFIRSAAAVTAMLGTQVGINVFGDNVDQKEGLSPR